MSAPSDRLIFAAAYTAHASAVFTHLLQRGIGRADAEDLTAEVFAIAWRRSADIRPHPTAGMLPWLLATANNLLRSKRRSLWRAHRALSRIERPTDVPDFSADLAQAAEDKARLAVLVDVLKGLTVAEQEVIQFCVLRGIGPAVVAQVTGEPDGTVRSRLSRALGKARARYAIIAQTRDDVADEPERTGR